LVAGNGNTWISSVTIHEFLTRGALQPLCASGVGSCLEHTLDLWSDTMGKGSQKKK
jgi:hypothetical protein